MGDYVKVGTVDDFPVNEVKTRIVKNEHVSVVNAQGKFYAFSGFCTHVRVPLRGSYVENKWVCCWLHFSVFNMETGECEDGPAKEPLSIYDVRLEGGDVLVSLG